MTDCLRDPVFYVGELDEDIDCSLPPSSGEEYIKRVVLEARQCPDVVVAEIDRTRFQNPTIDVEPLPGCVKAPESFGPTLEWKKLQMEDFINVHGQI
ncbi:hypothetical protein KM043_012425 [Ampulex compressa]|nr:hypothetical protein KM043_012425 [Ampulex compressa]